MGRYTEPRLVDDRDHDAREADYVAGQITSPVRVSHDDYRAYDDADLTRAERWARYRVQSLGHENVRPRWHAMLAELRRRREGR